MDLKDVKATPSTVYWCAQYRSYCVVLGFCEWDGACIIIELHDDEDVTGELRTTESCELWPDPISHLKHREGLEHLHHARVLTIEGWIGNDRINDIRPEHTWAKDEVQDVFGEYAFDYNGSIAQTVTNTIEDALEDNDTHEIIGEISGIDFSLNISCAYDEPSFTHAGCEACSPNTGNNVVECVGIHKDGDKFQYDVCESCLYRHQYGWS